MSCLVLRCACDAGGVGLFAHGDGDRLREALTLSRLFLESLRLDLR